RPHERNGFTVL
nr:Chain C, peptide from Tegument protein pp65 [Human betaherpesvirus 5]